MIMVLPDADVEPSQYVYKVAWIMLNYLFKKIWLFTANCGPWTYCFKAKARKSFLI